MRKRIEQLAKGKFEQGKPELVFSEENIEISVYQGETYTGEFLITCKNQIPIHGIVYTTNPRMKCLTPQFEYRMNSNVVNLYETAMLADSENLRYGESIRIRYQFYTKGLEEGQIEKGKFVIVCNRTEIRLSFCVSILGAYPQSNYGEIRNLGDFAVLAKESKEEALRIFYHKSFWNVLEVEGIREQMLYRGLLDTQFSARNMEEFLIGTGKKEKISISIEKQRYEFYEVKQEVGEVLEIYKDNWGFIELHFSSDAEFIRFEKDVITSDLFLGSVYSLEFYIDPKCMHYGKNYAKITIASPYENCVVEVMASTEEKHILPTIEKTYRSKKKKALVQIMELYISYRLKRIVTGVWVHETIELLDGLYVMEPGAEIYRLMKAQCLIINQQRQDAEWILSEFKRKWTNRMSPLWGYYLYLKSLMEKEPVLIERFTNEIEEIFESNKDSALLYWVLLYLKEEYDDSAYKLKSIVSYIKKGCFSTYFYIEAYYLIAQNPYFLTRLGSFEIRILRWAVRYHAITKDIALQIFAIMESTKEYKSILYTLLCAAYEVNPKPEHVGIICSYLIKGQKYDHKYHAWYEKGIELELRITGLYEAYLISMDERSILPVPKVIRKYFRYECAVPYKKLAVLYNNIIASKDMDMETYEEYYESIHQFAIEQIMQGHMDDNLAVIYETMLNIGQITEDIAKALAKILFLRKLVVFDKRVKRAMIYQSQMKEPQVIFIVNQSAYFQLISKDYVIIFEDEKGVRYVESISYQLQPLMDAQKYMEICLSLAPQELAHVLFHFENQLAMWKNQTEFVFEEEGYLRQILSSEKVSVEYKGKLLPNALRFYQKQGEKDRILECLNRIDYARLHQEDRKFALKLLIMYGFYEQAYEKVSEYGIDQIDTSSKAVLAEYMIEKYKTEDPCLMLLAYEVFHLEEYDKKIVEYLTRYYNGPTEEMVALWEVGNGFSIKMKELSERLLTQILYTESELEKSMPIFLSCYKEKENETLLFAYLSLCAHQYFMEYKKTEQVIFSSIEKHMENQGMLNDICKLALLFYYSKCKQLTSQQIQFADKLLEEYTQKNMYFAFYKEFPSDLQKKYHFYDKTFLEYRTNPSHQVQIHYRNNGSAIMKESMQNVYEGIFVKTFLMFFGEMIEYDICEVYDKKEQVVERSRLVSCGVYEKTVQTRYDLLNQMLISNTLYEDTDIYESMKRYIEYEEIAKAVFGLL